MSGGFIQSTEYGYLVLWCNSSQTSPSPHFSRLLEAIGLNAVAVPEHVDVGIGGHLAQGVRHRSRMLDVQVAPPEDRLDPLELREPRWKRSTDQLRVHASSILLFVAGSGLRPRARVQVREQGAGVGEPHQADPRAAAARACRPSARRPRCAAPGNRPRSRTTARGARATIRPARGSLYAAALARPYSSMPACSFGLVVVCRLTWQNAWNTHLCTFVEGHSAATAAAKAAAAVGHHHLRRGHARQKRPPRRGGLGAREVPRQHELVAAGYQHHAVARHPYAVDVDDAAGLVYGLRHRPYRPEPRAPAPERAACPGIIDLGFLESSQPTKTAGVAPRCRWNGSRWPRSRRSANAASRTWSFRCASWATRRTGMSYYSRQPPEIGDFLP